MCPTFSTSLVCGHARKLWSSRWSEVSKGDGLNDTYKDELATGWLCSAGLLVAIGADGDCRPNIAVASESHSLTSSRDFCDHGPWLRWRGLALRDAFWISLLGLVRLLALAMVTKREERVDDGYYQRPDGSCNIFCFGVGSFVCPKHQS